jgi:DNA-directed RNA polymerase specialized sigma subunit
MGEIKNKFDLYRERKCKIANKNIEIENLKLSGAKENDHRIESLKLEINELENENRRIDNILTLLPEKEYKVIKLVLIDGQDKKKVADEIERTERQINRILNKAAKKIVL